MITQYASRLSFKVSHKRIGRNIKCWKGAYVLFNTSKVSWFFNLLLATLIEIMYNSGLSALNFKYINEKSYATKSLLSFLNNVFIIIRSCITF